jgi:hypothetical protein
MWEPTIPGMGFNHRKLEDQRRCPLWVINRHSVQERRCPLYPRKRTSIIVNGILALFHSVRSTISLAIQKARMNGHLGSTTMRSKKFNLPAGGLRDCTKSLYFALSPHGALCAKPVMPQAKNALSEEKSRLDYVQRVHWQFRSEQVGLRSCAGQSPQGAVDAGVRTVCASAAQSQQTRGASSRPACVEGSAGPRCRTLPLLVIPQRDHPHQQQRLAAAWLRSLQCQAFKGCRGGQWSACAVRHCADIEGSRRTPLR